MKWVKVSERLPTEKDADDLGVVVIRSKQEGGTIFFLDSVIIEELESDDEVEWLEGARD